MLTPTDMLYRDLEQHQAEILITDFTIMQMILRQTRTTVMQTGMQKMTLMMEAQYGLHQLKSEINYTLTFRMPLMMQKTKIQ